jgi:diguanylate cyclase (GGDEF)-like protein
MFYVAIALAFHATLMALVVSRLLLDLRNLSRHDGLTGLLNRRAIEEAMQAQMRSSQRRGEIFCVLMFDLDHFKAINDRFGHAEGDRALKHAAQLLKSGMRDIDSLARIGGEEFLALVPGVGLADAQPLAERLRTHLADSCVVLGGTAVSLSVSIGVAQWSSATEDPSRLLLRADHALYQAKRLGRNRVVAAAAAAPAPPGATLPA